MTAIEEDTAADGRRAALEAWLRRRWTERRTWARRGAGALALWLVAVSLWRSGLEAPEPTVLVRDRHDRFLGEISLEDGETFGYWPLEDIPERVAAATLAIEDRRFWRHPGVDVLAAGRAAGQNLRSGRRVSGASTLAMQVARMQSGGTRSYGRKAIEALTAAFMTVRHGRRAVLAHYLRIVPYGNRIHGIGYAARRYLDKPVDDLSWAEIAFLAAIPQAPARMNPFIPSGRRRAVARGERILDLLLDARVLTVEEHDLARRQIVALQVPPAGERPREALHALFHVRERLLDPATRAGVQKRPIVRTTIDLDLQAEASWQSLRLVRSWEGQGAGNAAVIVLDRATSEVLAWTGSTDYFDKSHAGAIDYARVPRSPGSALKPFFFAAALDRGTITPATVLDDLDRGAGGITNSDDLFLGPLLPRAALGNSRNVPAADLVAALGVDESYALLQDLGLHRGEERARRYGLGLSIGGLPVTLEHLVRAYTALASGGRLVEPRWFAAQAAPEPRRIFSEEAARQVALFLADPMARLPSFARMGALEYPFPVAVKTGTSSRFRDAWTVALSSRYLVGVWVGHPDFRSMNRLTGYRSAAELAQAVLLPLHPQEADGLTDVPFPPPRGFETVRLCALTGHRAHDACDRVFTEWMRPGEGPVDACSAHVRVAIDHRTGRPAGRTTPPDAVEVRTFVDLPPRYAAWASAAGLPRLPQADRAPTDLRAGITPHLSVTSPVNGLRLLRDPETPADHATLALKAVVDPPTSQIVWYVDGQPYRVVDYPYTARWPLAPGDHVIEARLPNAPVTSGRVRVTVH